MRRLRKLLISLGILYIASFAAMFLMRGALVYPFTTTPEHPVGIVGMKEMRAPDAPELVVWVKRPRGDAPVLIFFGGNLGALASNVPRLRELAAQGLGFAAMGYRGSAGRAGKPSETALFEDAARLYDGLDALIGHAVPSQSRVIYGVSLGTGIATDLASQRAVGAVVLETPFTRFCDVAYHHYPIFPTCLALYDARFDNHSKIGRIDAPAGFAWDSG